MVVITDWVVFPTDAGLVLSICSCGGSGGDGCFLVLFSLDADLPRDKVRGGEGA